MFRTTLYTLILGTVLFVLVSSTTFAQPVFEVHNQVSNASIKVYVYNYDDPVRLISCDELWLLVGAHWSVPDDGWPKCGAYSKFNVVVTPTGDFGWHSKMYEVNRGERLYCTDWKRNPFSYIHCETR